jgi:hypothetical protein
LPLLPDLAGYLFLRVNRINDKVSSAERSRKVLDAM